MGLKNNKYRTYTVLMKMGADVSGASATPPEKRKRGRPKKVKPDTQISTIPPSIPKKTGTRKPIKNKMENSTETFEDWAGIRPKEAPVKRNVDGSVRKPKDHSKQFAGYMDPEHDKRVKLALAIAGSGITHDDDKAYKINGPEYKGGYLSKPAKLVANSKKTSHVLNIDGTKLPVMVDEHGSVVGIDEKRLQLYVEKVKNLQGKISPEKYGKIIEGLQNSIKVVLANETPYTVSGTESATRHLNPVQNKNLKRTMSREDLKRKKR